MPAATMPVRRTAKDRINFFSKEKVMNLQKYHW
jgi:hypothetical protein